ncbi:sensor histidine kinase [Isoptericola cucumis]|uniref:Oxygen sensor histidine kinase NreB n=1 Tax=Isoptericola cucumis TaxID=1776856 RepID=A0ABQ2BAK9_9MICO|nr:sensor histidine kinase [Isoptericola cucumis]GGI10198.1 two-component sensor histidine kinase [Isoptericola cucumis]
MTTADGARPDAEDVARYDAADVDHWQKQVVWWDRTFVAIVVLTAIALPLAGQSGRELWTAYAAMAVILVAYAVWGASAARSRDQRRAGAYVVVLIAGTTVTVAQNGIATLLLFGAFTQLWMLLEPVRRAVVASVVLAAASSFGIAFQEGFDVPTLLEAAPQMAIALAFAIMLGLWVATTMQRSDERARLLHELRHAQAEVAASHHAAGVTAERERIAREIHDTLAQGFTSVVTQAQAAVSDLDRGQQDRALERLHLVEQTARDNLAEARALVAAFAPVPLQGSTLAEALRRLADRFTAETGVAVRLDVSGTGPADAPRDAAADVVVLRAAQEALANVRRHAGADAVTIRLDAGTDAALRLEVTDDGRGLPAEHAEGLGLAGMRERVAAAGGRLDVGPAGDHGTRVAVSLPLEETS